MPPTITKILTGAGSLHNQQGGAIGLIAFILSPCGAWNLYQVIYIRSRPAGYFPQPDPGNTV